MQNGQGCYGLPKVAPRAEIRLDGTAGGSVSGIDFTTITYNVGGVFTAGNLAASSSSFVQVSEPGVYAVSFYGRSSSAGGEDFYIQKNTASLIGALSNTNVLGKVTQPATANLVVNLHATAILAANDKIYIQWSNLGSASTCMLRITQIAK